MAQTKMLLMQKDEAEGDVQTKEEVVNWSILIKPGWSSKQNTVDSDIYKFIYCRDGINLKTHFYCGICNKNSG